MLLLSFRSSFLFLWNDAATYDARSKTGGPDGSIRFRIEQELKKEASMHKAVQYCGVVAIEVTKGPTIDFVPGRKDSYDLRAEQHLEYGEEANKSCLILSADWDEFRKGKRLFLNGKEEPE
ncbi:hypothetical protein VNO78_08498 [Psophocarpus tetragonolobus]|uniref:Uncharacterized protein n=1 Tax=Psophocarpus tetragonolobus TaxID=3891 RepID=A0AAN9SUY1_PSOTE